MAQQNINYGTVPNDGTGDVYRVAIIKIQNNFTDLYTNKVDKTATIALTGGATGTATALAGATVVIPITGLNMGSATAGTLAVAHGGTGVTTATGTGANVQAVSPALTGTPTVPTAAAGTNTTQVASMAAVQEAVTGYLAKPLTGGAVTLTEAEGSNTHILFTGTLTSNAVVTFPNVRRIWLVGNVTAGDFTVTIKGATAATAEAVRGNREFYALDTSGAIGKAAKYVRDVSEGGTGVTTSTGTGSTVLSASPALTGTPTVPTAATATSTTQAASTAFVQAVNSADTGSSATSVALKTARNFSVSGGATAAAKSFNGTTDVVLDVTALDVSKATAGTLAVARGGTGVTTSTGTGSTVLSASPALTGIPTVPTAATATSTTQAASTEFVQAVNSADTGSSATAVTLKTARTFAISGGATAAAQTFNGGANVVLNVTDLDVSVANAGTLAVARGGTGTTTSTGTGANVQAVSPALTGTPTVPTAAATVNNTQAASTAFVRAALSNPLVASDYRIGPVNTQYVYTSAGWTGRASEWAQALEANGSLAFHSYNNGTYIKPAAIFSKDGSFELKGMLTANGYTNPEATAALTQVGEIGTGFANWAGSAKAVIQLNCQVNTSAYFLWRATKQGFRHLAAMSVHAQNSDAAPTMVSLAITGTGGAARDNAFVWYGDGDYQVQRNITAGGTITPNSDIRLKNVLSKVCNPMQKIRAIESIIYTRKDVDNGVRYGYSAQSVEGVMPEAVVYSKPGEHQKAFVGDEVKSVDYNGVSVLHNEALIEHDDDITALKQELAELKELVKSLLSKA